MKYLRAQKLAEVGAIDKKRMANWMYNLLYYVTESKTGYIFSSIPEYLQVLCLYSFPPFLKPLTLK